MGMSLIPAVPVSMPAARLFIRCLQAGCAVLPHYEEGSLAAALPIQNTAERKPWGASTLVSCGTSLSLPACTDHEDQLAFAYAEVFSQAAITRTLCLHCK